MVWNLRFRGLGRGVQKFRVQAFRKGENPRTGPLVTLLYMTRLSLGLRLGIGFKVDIYIYGHHPPRSTWRPFNSLQINLLRSEVTTIRAQNTVNTMVFCSFHIRNGFGFWLVFLKQNLEIQNRNPGIGKEWGQRVYLY